VADAAHGGLDFDHNDLFHPVQMAGLALIVAGLEVALRRRPEGA
jgi:hypothetical protein